MYVTHTADAPSPPLLSPLRFHAIVAVSGIAFGFTSPLTAVFAVALGAGGLLAGVAVSSANMSVLVIDIFGTRWTPRLEARAAVTAALLIFGTGSLATAFTGGYRAMVCARVVQGIGVALFLGVGPQLAVRLAGSGPAGTSRAGRALGGFNAAWFAGIALGPLFGGWVAGQLDGTAGIRLAFGTCGVLSGLIAGLVWAVLPRTASGRPPQLGLPRLGRVAGRRPYAVLATGCLGQAIRSGVAITIVPLFGSQVLHLSTPMLGVALSCLAVTDVAAMGVAARASDIRGRLPVLLPACAWGIAAIVVLLTADPRIWFLPVCAALGLTVGLTWVVPGAMAVDVIDDQETALAAYRISADFGVVLGGISGGAAVGTFGVRGALGAGAVHLLIIGLLGLAIGETRRRAKADVPIPTFIGGHAMQLPELPNETPAPPAPQPTAALVDALVADQGLEFLSPERRDAALATHRSMRPALLKLRAVPLRFIDPVSEPASALAWLESGGVSR
jgi:MFS family permease